MAATYLALLLFIVIAIAVPALLIISSILIRTRKRQTKTSGLNFESAEESVGVRTSIMSEYFHYFTGFLAFEVVAAIFVLWVYVEGLLSAFASDVFIGFMLGSLFLEYFVVLYALRRKE